MSKSQHCAYNANAGDTILAGQTRYVPWGVPDTETTGEQTPAGETEIREAGDVDFSQWKLRSNTLNGNLVITLLIDGVATTHTLTFSAGSTTPQTSTTPASVAAGEAVGWKLDATAASTGEAQLMLISDSFDPDAAGNCVTFLGTFGASSSPQTSASTTRLFPLNGDRASDSEANVVAEIPVPGTLRGFYAGSGTNSWTGTVTMSVRINAVNSSNLEVSFGTGEEGINYDITGSEAVSADDEVCYRESTDGGSGTWNLERMGCEFVSTNNKFLLLNTKPSGTSYSDDRSFAPAGMGFGSTTLTAGQMEAGFNFTVAELILRLVAVTLSTTNGNTLRTRENGTGQTLRARFNGDAGTYYDIVDKVDLVAGDDLDLLLDHVSGNYSLEYTCLVGDATGGGGGGTATPPTFDVDSVHDSGAVGASPSSHSIPVAVEATIGILALIAQSGSSADDVSGIAYGGTAMTRVPTNGLAQDTTTEVGASYAYTLDGSVPLETQDIVVTHGGAGTKYLVVVAFKGDGGISVVASGKVEDNTANPSVSLDSGADLALRFAALFSGLGNPVNINAGTGFSIIVRPDFGATTAAFEREDTATSGSVATGFGVANDDVAMVAVAIAEAAGAGQTATPDAASAAFSVPAPAVSAGGVSLAPDPAAVAFSVPAPAVSAGAVTLEPDPAGVAFSVPAPTVAPGAVNLTPDPVAVAMSVPAPTVSQGGTIVTPDPVAVALSVATPTVSPGAVALAPDPAAVAFSVATPTLAPGAVSLTPDPAAVAFSIATPTLAPGGVTLTPDAVTVAFSVATPTVAEEGTIAPDPVSVAFSVATPTLQAGGVVLTPSPVSVAFSVPAPDVGSGAVIAAELAAFAFSVPTPAVSAGGVVLAPDAAVVAFSVPVPSVSGGEFFATIYASPGDGPTSTVLAASLTSTVLSSSDTETN